VEKFEHREHLQGCVIYDKEGGIFAKTDRLSDWENQNKPYIFQTLLDRSARGRVQEFKEYTLYSYILPILDDRSSLLGLIEILHDTSYVYTRLTEIWKRISISLIVLVVMIVLVTGLIQRRIFILPIVQLTEWFYRFQKGETNDLRPFQRKDEIGRLASQVEQVALSLRVARRTLSQEAHVNIQKEELWTQKKLSHLIQAKLGDNALFVVSNREPYMHVFDKDRNAVRCLRPPSGVVTAIDPILRACGGTWIAHGSGDADKKFVNSQDKLGVPPEDNRYIIKRVWLTKEEEEGYYYGFSNEGLWPLCHITHTRPIFREADWQMYQKANSKFADAVLEELPAQNPFIFIQDYHFALLPRMIKEKRPDAIVALFWHIPWPNPEALSICPYQKTILEGMLSCDLIGFHVQYHCNNFLDAANRFLESRVDMEKFSVIQGNKETLIRTFPISIDHQAIEEIAQLPPLEMETLKREFRFENKILALGVDRIDYTKGIVERMLAVDRFLEKYPQYKDKFTFVQLAAPSRTHIKRYHDLMSEIEELVEKINWKYQDDSVKPIVYLKRHFSLEEIAPFYALADICIVSSLHDGMNLVAKEYVASKRDLNGVLILSCFTGASRELTDAIPINPYSTEEFADGIKTAVEMPLAEKKRRMENLRRTVKENNVYRWAGNIVNELTALKKGLKNS